MLDVISIGSCIAELTPVQPGVPLARASELEIFPSGSSANFVLAAARLGLQAALVSRVGEDEIGSLVTTRLRRAGVNTSHIFVTPGQLTAISLCWADGEGEKFFYHYRFPGFCDPLAELTSDCISDDFLAGGRMLHFSEACIREPKLRQTTFEIARRFRSHGGEVVYCPNYRGLWREGTQEMMQAQQQAASMAGYLVLNDEEASVITGKSEKQAVKILQGLGPHTVIVTQGKKGVHFYNGEECGFLPAYKVPVVYDVGAGDTFQAGFLAGKSQGMSLADSVRFGAAAAAIRISHSGDPALLPTGDKVKEFIETN